MNEILGLDEFRSLSNTISLLEAVLAEFFGNFMLNLFGCASVVAVMMLKMPPITIAFCFGLIVFVVVESLGHVSGAHINPAVTIAMMSILKTNIIRGLLYMIAQCLGSLAGSATLMALTPKEWRGWNSYNLGVTALNPSVTAVQGFGIELLLGFLLVMTICGVLDSNLTEPKPSGSLAIGLSVTLGVLAFMGFTGASMNPARSFGSAVIANFWNKHWVYWAGPIVGGVIAALIYKFAFSPKSKEEKTETQI